MKKTILALALSAPFLASAQNLLTNGSFESGLLGWTTTATPGAVYPVSVISYGPGAAFGETVPVDNSASLSSDAAASKAIYFVEDNGVLTLSQTFNVSVAGLYGVGFSTYAPANGYANPGEASFSAVLDSVPLLTTTVSSLSPVVWTANSATLNLSAGTHTVAFRFETKGGFSKDVVIDRVHVTAVPEPESVVLLLAGLAVVGSIARRRRVL